MKLPRESPENAPPYPSSGSTSVGSSFMVVPQTLGLMRNEREVDFSEYEWMGHEMEEFDRQCIEEFWEEAFIEAMFEDMLQEEEEVHLLLSNLSRTERVDLVEELRRISLSLGEDSPIPEICLLDEDDEDSEDSFDGSTFARAVPRVSSFSSESSSDDNMSDGNDFYDEDDEEDR